MMFYNIKFKNLSTGIPYSRTLLRGLESLFVSAINWHIASMVNPTTSLPQLLPEVTSIAWCRRVQHENKVPYYWLGPFRPETLSRSQVEFSRMYIPPKHLLLKFAVVPIQ